MNTEPLPHHFIICDALLRKEGSNYVGGKQRIQCYIDYDLPISELATSLKKEYGIGGYAMSSESGYAIYQSHDSKGISYELVDYSPVRETTLVKYTWKQVAIIFKERGLIY